MGLKIAEKKKEAVNGRRPGSPVTSAQKNPQQTDKQKKHTKIQKKVLDLLAPTEPHHFVVGT